MYVMCVDAFLERYKSGERKLEPHQLLKSQGLVGEWDGTSEVLFISHEWLAVMHPDPGGVQTAELCIFLERLQAGCIDADLHWQQIVTTTPTLPNFRRIALRRVTGAEFKRRMVGAKIWLDYLSVPQLRGADSSAIAAPSATAEVSNGVSDHRLVDSPPSPVCAADHSFASAAHASTISSAALHKDLNAAVASIPAYVMRCSIFVTFAPTCVLEEQIAHTSEQIGYAPTSTRATSNATYRRRGWTRAECLFAWLSSRPDALFLAARSGRGKVTLGNSWWTLLPGEGDFSCCQLNHSLGGRPIECDKPKLRRLIERAVDAKVRWLTSTRMHAHSEERACHVEGDRNVEWRFYVAMLGHLLRGLHAPSPTLQLRVLGTVSPTGVIAPRDDAARSYCSCSQTAASGCQCTGPACGCGAEGDAVETLRRLLCWSELDDADGKRTGWTLLKFAVVANNVRAVRMILDSRKLAESRLSVDEPLHESYCHLAAYQFLHKKVTNLHVAMCIGTPAVVRLLLDAGANPYAEDVTLAGTPFHYACGFGQPENIGEFLSAVPTFDVDRRRSPNREAATGLHMALLLAPYPRSVPTVRQLLQSGASLAYRMRNGRTVLHSLALSEDCDVGLLAEFAAAPDIRIDERAVALSLNWRVVFAMACFKWRWRQGTCSSLVSHIAHLHKSTALHCAARRGDLHAVSMLLSANADPTVVNAIGLDAKKVVQSFAGPMPAVEELCAAAVLHRRQACFGATGGQGVRSRAGACVAPLA
jgi:ankyrin repeat protein